LLTMPNTGQITSEGKCQKVEMILGVIEDLLDKFEQGSAEEKEDARNTLQLERDQFLANLKPLVDGGNEVAKILRDRLEKIQF
jgi:hypothetical protein